MTLEQELDAVRRVQSGDMDAFERLVTANEKQVFHLAKGKLGNEQDAQDATQETFLKVYTSIGKFRGDCRFSVWVYRIATNVCLDMLRKKGRRPEVSLVRTSEDDEEETETQVPDVELSPEVLLEKKLTIESVRAGLETLPEDHRKILLLREIHGLSYEEISQALDLEVGTVKSRIFRARKKLAAFLIQSGNIPDWISSGSLKGGDVR